MTCVIGGVWNVSNGHDVAGTAIATTTVVGLAGVFVYGALMRRNERRQKVEAASVTAPK
jgi:hypothetical protein